MSSATPFSFSSSSSACATNRSPSSIIMSYRQGSSASSSSSETSIIKTTTTTTTQPPPHKHDYERKMSRGRISDADIELLKNLILASRGIRTTTSSPLPTPHSRRRLTAAACAARKPRIPPKGNETSRIRMEWRAYRLYQRCGTFFQPPPSPAPPFVSPDEEGALLSTPQHQQQHQQQQQKQQQKKRQTERAECAEEMPTAKETLTKYQLEEMLRVAKHLTPEQIEDELDRRELQRLREQALSTQGKEAAAFRDNQCSAYRYKLARGEPVVTSQFRETFADFMKPPFVSAVRSTRFVAAAGATAKLRLPPIDKYTELWLWPVDDDADAAIPLHRQPKDAPTAQPDTAADKRSAREKARPPLRPHKRTRRVKSGDSERRKRPKRVPWNFGVPTSPLLVKARDNFIHGELARQKEQVEVKSGSGAVNAQVSNV